MGHGEGVGLICGMAPTVLLEDQMQGAAPRGEISKTQLECGGHLTEWQLYKKELGSLGRSQYESAA